MIQQSMKPGTLRIAIVSDLHVCEKATGASFIQVGAGGEGRSRDPIAGLLNLFHEHSLHADLLVCPGDLTNRASKAGAQHAWATLQVLRKALGAERIVATAGNHDMDSRHAGSVEASEVLRALQPPFPFEETALADQYWARYFAVIDDPSYRIVVLNSCAHHGQSSGSGGQPDEFQHGRVLPQTTAELRDFLSKAERRPLNILVCHHHPYRYSDIYDRDYSEMEGGADLLSVLESDSPNRWVVIHGHKHYARVAYSYGSSRSPIVFCAGSLSARLSPEQSALVRNQFYLVDFPLAEYSRLQLSVAASFKSWDWIYARGWVEAGDRSGLPANGGFGSHVEAQFVAAEISTIIGDRPFVDWSEVLTRFPQLAFVLPQDLKDLFGALERNFRFRIFYDQNGSVAQVANGMRAR